VTRRVAVAGTAGRARPTKKRYVRGYSKGRQAYDRRRRSLPLDAEGRAFKAIVLCDPCSFCGVRLGTGRGEQPAADHVTPLEVGGPNDASNLAGVCRRCNAMKGNGSVLEMLMRKMNGDG
jgi:5-methylcytosine-specific restriction endonuclease McrA